MPSLDGTVKDTIKPQIRLVIMKVTCDHGVVLTRIIGVSEELVACNTRQLVERYFSRIITWFDDRLEPTLTVCTRSDENLLGGSMADTFTLVRSKIVFIEYFVELGDA